ncbi:hypothetical protein D9M71_454980 [compost metagenome]
MPHGVVDQQLTNQVIYTKVCPTGAGQLAQVMAGPLAAPQPSEHRTRLPFTQRLAVSRRKQKLAVISSGLLHFAVPNQQLADLFGQRQVMLDAGLGVLGRNEPLTLSQADVRPARLPGFADAGAMAEHHQGQHAVSGLALVDAVQLFQQIPQLHAAQPRRFHADLRL